MLFAGLPSETLKRLTTTARASGQPVEDLEQLRGELSGVYGMLLASDEQLARLGLDRARIAEVHQQIPSMSVEGLAHVAEVTAALPSWTALASRFSALPAGVREGLSQSIAAWRQELARLDPGRLALLRDRIERTPAWRTTLPFVLRAYTSPGLGARREGLGTLQLADAERQGLNRFHADFAAEQHSRGGRVVETSGPFYAAPPVSGFVERPKTTRWEHESRVEQALFRGRLPGEGIDRAEVGAEAFQLRRGGRRRPARQAQALEDPADRLGRADRSQDPHPAAAGGTPQNFDRPHRRISSAQE